MAARHQLELGGDINTEDARDEAFALIKGEKALLAYLYNVRAWPSREDVGETCRRWHKG